jgi:hypothetical protein
MLYYRYFTVFFAALFITGCSGTIPQASPQAQIPPKTSPKKTPTTLPAPKSNPGATQIPVSAGQAAIPSGNWTEWALASGKWVYRKDGQNSAASFGPNGRAAPNAPAANVVVQCDLKLKRISLSRVQQAATPTPAAQMRLRASDGLHAWAARAVAGTPPYLAVDLPANDPALDMLAFSRGRFAIEVAGEASLALPLWSEVARVIEDCR